MNRPVVANLQYGGDYLASLEKAAETGKCIFCEPEFQSKYLHTFGGWMVLHNEYPTKDREGGYPQAQLLFVSRGHGNDEEFLSREDFSAIGFLLERCNEELGLEGGCFFFRNGNPAICGRTVRHPHAHYYVPRQVAGEDGALKTIPIDIPAG